jgi:hypothetical protein
MPKFVGYDDLYENIAAAVRLHRLAENINRFVFEENAAELTYDQRSMISRKISESVEEAVGDDTRALLYFAIAAVDYFEEEPR